MYKVNYYTLGKMQDGSVGNIKQFDNVWYTEQEIEIMQTELQRVVDIMYNDKYQPVIVSIERIKGHCGR